ncbi:Peptide-N4-(N-acetyl-beta-glucosaminyl)asparagine amidase A [Parasponia andersonii]|uniref:Peptide-N4-(N-acetyl-beta-glucosaminyl)asparagine amidase A n=1 Tax=Parasponia andersonii TaxID=3476 RepID=A0A2P5A5Y2_PARAD|nr:Peptide-N4-(N-acetyl-beta-glucosaminyl)asparagine amidase A [Parasponia andersonii]
MASSPFPLLSISLFLLFLLLHQPLFSTTNLHKLRSLRPDFLPQISTPSSNDTPLSPPTHYFETPPSHCLSHPKEFSKIFLEWRAISKGRQYDRIFGVWVGGVELLRSCTAEPIPTGIVWSVEKDIARYYSLRLKNQTLAVYLGNVIDKAHYGIYHVNVTLHFYPPEEENLDSHGGNRENLVPGYNSWADLVLPISRNLPLNDGLWFEIENSTNFVFKELKIPRNVYRAVLEVYVSFHENDEFWYSNVPNEYIDVYSTSFLGNGPFREVLVSLDGDLVGSIWPFTVIYTGGVSPLLWRPISGIGSFSLPSYDIEITPFLGKILDGKTHKIGLNVTNALNVCYIDANLHLWLDKHGVKTEWKILKHVGLPLVVSLVSNFSGFDGTFLRSVSRSIKLTGWVKSSYGNITTNAIQDFYYNKLNSDGRQWK